MLALVNDTTKYTDVRTFDDLEEGNNLGYVLLAIVPHDLTDSWSETVYAPNNDSCGYAQSSTNYPLAVMRRVRYVMGRDEKSALAKLYTDNEDLKGSLNAAKVIADESLTKVAELEETLERKYSDLESANKSLRESVDKVSDLNGQINRYEKDLGKIREAIGEIKLKEILKDD